MIISAGDRSSFINALVRWAMASAVMDGSDFSDLVSWVVRLSEGNVEATLLEEARRLLARNNPTASAAARTLLLTIGSGEAFFLMEEHGLASDSYEEERGQDDSDPCKSLFGWTESECLSCLGREDVPLHIILGRATLPIVDPSIALPASLIQRAKAALASINPAMIRACSSQTIEGHHLDTLTPILCAHAPSELADFIRTVVRTMPDRDLNGQYFLALELPEISQLLRSDEVLAVSKAMVGLSTDASEWSFEDKSGPRHMKKIAEARAFNGIAPHLSSSELFRRLITRSENAYDLDGFELWFAPIPQDETRKAIDVLHSPPDGVTLIRILWALPYLRVPLSELDLSRLVQLADSEDPRVRSGAMRVAVLAQDKSLGRRLVDLGRSADKDTGPWEAHWLTFLLARFSNHLAFEDLAKRLRPSAIGFVIGERGNRPNEIEMYARCLDEEWRQIVSAVDPEIERLPAIVINNDPNDSGVRLPELHEPSTSQTIRFDRSSSWTSGPPTNPISELNELLCPNVEEKVRELNQDLRSKIDAILAAWRTDAYQWYGRGFSVDTMEKIYQRHPAVVERWIEPALQESLTGLSMRVRLGTFLDPICRVLLNWNQRLGLKLWRTLHNRENSPVVFDTGDIAFSSEDCPESKVARDIVLDECWDDASLARVAFSCNKSGRQDWLDDAIGELISAQQLWRRMKGLTLASLSDITPERFEELVSSAAVGESWVEGALGPLRENVRKNLLARHWYFVFLTAEDSDAAWGALQIVLSLADERLLHWGAEIAKACASSSMAEKRLRLLDLKGSRRDLRREIGRESVRKERLFGLKIQRGEIVPFM